MNQVLHLRRDFPVTSLELFEHFTHPEKLISWFFPDGCIARSARLDPRVGGSFFVDLEGLDGEEDACIQGTVLESEPGKRLIFTWLWTGGPLKHIPESTVELEFFETETGCRLVVRQGFFSTEEFRQIHESGWHAALKKLF